MEKVRRELSTADMARAAEASERAAVISPDQAPPRQPVTNQPQRDEPRELLFDDNEARQFRTRWTDIQAAFVDSPRAAVERADALVAETMKRMAEMFSGARTNLESQWDRGGDVTTEDLRIALQRYRAFFDRLLNV